MPIEANVVPQLMEALGLGAAEPDEAGTWSLRIGKNLLILMRVTPDASALLLSAPIGLVEADVSAAALRILCQAATPWLAQAGVVPGLAPGGSTVLLSARLVPEELASERFLERLEQFMVAAVAWRESLPGLLAGEDTEPGQPYAAAEVLNRAARRPDEFPDFA